MISRRILVAVTALAMAGGPVDKLEGRHSDAQHRVVALFVAGTKSAAKGVIAHRNDVVHLNQGWSAQDRLRYYYTSQGSAALSYDILLNLETPNNQGLFRADENLARYGLIPQQADPKYNPDALPIGVTKTVVADGRWKGEWVGLGCAACHNGLLEYKGSRISVSGGSNSRLDVHALINGLDDAVTATLADPGKFDRLAERMGQHDNAGKERLRKRLQMQAAMIHTYRSRTALTPTVVGPGRMDALRLIHNRVQATMLGVPENWVAPLAPVKPSFVWNVPQSAWAQWTAVLPDPLARNAGEAMGVFAQMDLTSKTPTEGLFESTLDLKGLIYSEDLLRRLAPPSWPEEILGKIDRVKSAKGREVFVQRCAQCHSTWPHRWSEPKKQGKRVIENAIVSAEVVGTDETVFGSPQFQSQPTMMAGPLSDHLEPPLRGAVLVPPPAIFATASRGVMTRALAKLGLSDAEILSARGYRAVYPEPVEPIPALGAYKANPAEGMWSSPPFLHNGSVSSLYELLMPAGERSKTFFIGREFDPVKVGVDVSGNSGKFQFDTRLIGNSNAGHSFENGPVRKGVIGPLLTDDERWAIIEYLKSIPSQPAQIAAFGGPADPIRAWGDTTFYHVKHPGTYNGAPAVQYRGGDRDTARPPSGLALAQERPEPNEDSLTAIITKVSIDRLRKQFPPGVRPVLRDAHPKMHGLVRAEFTVLDHLPEQLRYGVFKTPRAFDALIRFSGGGIEVKPDTVPQGAGMAIKLLGVEGEKILPAERNAKTQDFVMINFPGFFVKNLEDYMLLHEALAKDELETFFKTRPEELAAIKGIRDQPVFNPLQVAYFSQTPFKLGPHAMKFSAKPRSPGGNVKPATMGPDFKHDAMVNQLGTEDVYFDFFVQLQIDPVKMPIENPLVIWDESLSPFVRVATIRIPRQGISAKAWQDFGENLTFDPWHALPDHRPLGSMNRARRAIYEALSDFRHKMNGVARQEPTAIPR